MRREWLATFVARKTAPKGAEALICEAVVTGHHSLSKAMDHRHPMLFTLLGVDRPTGYYGAGHDECHKIATKASTPKAATMTTLAAVVAASPSGVTGLVAEAQAMGAPIWTLQKTSSREAWMHLKPIFQKVAHTMGVME